MLIQINILIQDMILDQIFIHSFHFQILIGEKNVVNFGVDNSSSVHIGNKKKFIFALGKDPTQRLDDTTITAEAEYSINFS